MNTNFKMTAVKDEIFFCYEPCRRQLSLDHNFMLSFISLLNYIPKELPLFYKLHLVYGWTVSILSGETTIISVIAILTHTLSDF